MEILFIVDTVKDIERKISLLENLGEDIKFFVYSKCVTKLVGNKEVLDKIVAIYNKNVNVTIDKYLNSKDYVPTQTLLYYASAELTAELVDNIRENLKLNPSTIYVKKKFSFWDKFKFWFYKKIIKLIFGIEDECASVKVQYFSTKLMEVLAKTNFKNHIFSIPKALNIELKKEDAKSYYNRTKFDKNYLYNPIVFCLILICYVVLERFLDLSFWVYFLVIALLLATIVNLLVMIVKNTFDCRYKK